MLQVATPARSRGFRCRGPTQAPHMDISAAGTDTAEVDHDTLCRMLRQLNTFSRRHLFLGRFVVLGPRHRRQGGTPCCTV